MATNGTRLRDVAHERAAEGLHGAVAEFVSESLFYRVRTDDENRSAMVVAKAHLHHAVRKYFFRTVLAATSRAADRSDFDLMKAARKAEKQVYGSRVA